MTDYRIIAEMVGRVRSQDAAHDLALAVGAALAPLAAREQMHTLTTRTEPDPPPSPGEEHSLADLDRCPHGRRAGDVCAGWRGPGDYDGGCRDGTSLGNPYLARGQLIGTGLRGEPIHAPFGCDAYDCPLTAREEFTVIPRATGLEGWPEGGPELRGPLALKLHEGTVIRFCGWHGHQLREAAHRQRTATTSAPTGP